MKLISEHTSLYDMQRFGSKCFRMCTACRVVCDWVTHNMTRSTQITAWNTCCQNAAYHITMCVHWSIS